MLVVDVFGLKFIDGIEYFLCEFLMGNYLWDEDKYVCKVWYNVVGGSGFVEFFIDIIFFSVEVIYNCSYCWFVVKVWEGEEDGDVLIF